MNAELKDLLVKGAIGLGAIVTGFVGGWCALYWKTRNQRVDYEDLKRQRRLARTAENDRIERAGKVKDILIDLNKSGIQHTTFWEFTRMITTGKPPPGVGPPPKVSSREVLPLAVTLNSVYSIIGSLYVETTYLCALESLEDAEKRADPSEIESCRKQIEEMRSRVPKLNELDAESLKRSLVVLLVLLYITGIRISRKSAGHAFVIQPNPSADMWVDLERMTLDLDYLRENDQKP